MPRVGLDDLFVQIASHTGMLRVPAAVFDVRWQEPAGSHAALPQAVQSRKRKWPCAGGRYADTALSFRQKTSALLPMRYLFAPTRKCSIRFSGNLVPGRGWFAVEDVVGIAYKGIQVYDGV